MYYAAFYTDCERELSQVTRGCVLALVYNLTRAASCVGDSGDKGGGKVNPTAAGDGSPAGELAAVTVTKKEAEQWGREDEAFFYGAFRAPAAAADSSASDRAEGSPRSAAGVKVGWVFGGFDGLFCVRGVASIFLLLCCGKA